MKEPEPLIGRWDAEARFRFPGPDGVPAVHQRRRRENRRAWEIPHDAGVTWELDFELVHRRR